MCYTIECLIDCLVLIRNPVPRVLSYSSPGAEVEDREDPRKRDWFSSQPARL